MPIGYNSLPPLVAHMQCFPPSFFDLMKKTLSMNHIQPPPPPVIQDGVQEFEVEKILDSQVFQGRLDLVCWKGYGAADDLWIPAKEAVGAKRHIAEFHKQNPEAPKHISAAVYTALCYGCNTKSTRYSCYSRNIILLFSRFVLLFSVLRLISDLNSELLVVPFLVIVPVVPHNRLIIFPFRRYIHSHRYIYEHNHVW